LFFKIEDCLDKDYKSHNFSAEEAQVMEKKLHIYEVLRKINSKVLFISRNSYFFFSGLSEKTAVEMNF
jgi:hypothetical protein